MCGISGIANFKCTLQALSSVLDDMLNIQRARGPDGAGCYISANGSVAFAHNHLSIVGLGNNTQPFVIMLDGKQNEVRHGAEKVA
ncbi:MAG: hypothetical protein EB059_06750 [Alphaproteobacteria bacterium]|nr:hypothetical protein [Alphaproteobacteria bacterium]